MKKYLFIILACLMVTYTITYSAGFGIYEHGAKAMAQAGAFTARADNASAIFYNPAGLSNIEGTQIYIGTTLIAPSAELTDMYGETYEAKSQIFYPSNLYIAHRFTDNITAGFGVFNPFGLGMDWGEDYSGRFIVTNNEITSFDLSPCISYKINDNISIGVGLDYLLTTLTQESKIDLGSVNSYLEGMEIKGSLEGDNGSGSFGFHLGLQAKLTDALKLGIRYKSGFTVDFDGTVKFKGIPNTGIPELDQILAGLFAETNLTTSVKLPAIATLGVAYDITDKLQAEFDLTWEGWSVYDKYTLDYDNPLLPDREVIKNWDDTLSFRLGGQYMLNDNFALRAGYLFEQTAIPDETIEPGLPGADRHSIQLGLGYQNGPFTIDVAYMYIKFLDRDVTGNEYGYDVTYKSSGNLFGFNFSYTF